MTELLLKLFVKDYKQTDKESVREKYGLLGSLFGLVTNLLLAVAKIVIGLLLHMSSILADSVNNLSDFGNNVLSIFGFKISAKPADTDHPFGHQRMEYVVSLILAMVIMVLGGIMFYQGIRDFIEFVQSIQNTGSPVIDNSFQNADGTKNSVYLTITLVILVAAVFVKFLQSALYYSLGKRINSLQLSALSKDSRNDVISTILVIAGVVITWLTGYDVDCFFALAVSVLVVSSGIGIMKSAAEILIGQKPDRGLIKNMVKLISKQQGVLGMHDLTMHCYGSVIYAVIHIEVDANKPAIQSHEVCDYVEKLIYDTYHVNLTVHMDPIFPNDPETNKYREKVIAVLKEYKKESGVELKMHDFRMLNESTNKKLIFDLVIPDQNDNAVGKDSVKGYITKRLNEGGKEQIDVSINFDDELRDFLSGTTAEDREE